MGRLDVIGILPAKTGLGMNRVPETHENADGRQNENGWGHIAGTRTPVLFLTCFSYQQR